MTHHGHQQPQIFLVRLADAVVVNRHHHVAGGDAGSERELPSRLRVVRARDRRAIHRAIGHRHLPLARLAQGHLESELALRLDGGGIGNRYRGRFVVVHDHRCGGAIRQDHADPVRQQEIEGLVGFVQIVVDDRDGDRLRGRPAGEGQRAGRRGIIFPRRCRPIRRPVGHRQFPGGRPAERQPEHGFATRLADRGIRDRQLRQPVVVPD